MLVTGCDTFDKAPHRRVADNTQTQHVAPALLLYSGPSLANSAASRSKLTVRIVLVTGSESFNQALYKSAALELVGKAPHIVPQVSA